MYTLLSGIRLTSRYGNHHCLLLFGLAPPTARLAGVGDD